MLVLTIGLILFIIFHQRKVIRYQLRLQQMEQEQQKILLKASIRLQEEERQRLAADLHDDAGPLLATARLYLNENLVNQDKVTQLQSIYQARQILDDTIQLIRNISHSLMPPTLKNFGLESAVNDMFQKISGSGQINASSRFHEYKDRLKPEKELIVYRVLQELLNNTIKHAPIIKFGPYGYPKPTNIAKVNVKGNEIQTKKGVIAIDTTNAGSDAPPYYVENNKIVNGLLYLSEKDINNDNELINN